MLCGCCTAAELSQVKLLSALSLEDVMLVVGLEAEILHMVFTVVGLMGSL